MMHGEMISRMREYGESLVKSIKTNDPRVSASVRLTFKDGSQSTIPSAFTETAGECLCVASATDGYFLFEKSDLSIWTSEATPSGMVLTHEPMARGAARPAA